MQSIPIKLININRQQAVSLDSRRLAAVSHVLREHGDQVVIPGRLDIDLAVARRTGVVGAHLTVVAHRLSDRHEQMEDSIRFHPGAPDASVTLLTLRPPMTIGVSPIRSFYFGTSALENVSVQLCPFLTDGPPFLAGLFFSPRSVIHPDGGMAWHWEWNVVPGSPMAINGKPLTTGVDHTLFHNDTLTFGEVETLNHASPGSISFLFQMIGIPFVPRWSAIDVYDPIPRQEPGRIFAMNRERMIRYAENLQSDGESVPNPLKMRVDRVTGEILAFHPGVVPPNMQVIQDYENSVVDVQPLDPQKGISDRAAQILAYELAHFFRNDMLPPELSLYRHDGDAAIIKFDSQE